MKEQITEHNYQNVDLYCADQLPPQLGADVSDIE